MFDRSLPFRSAHWGRLSLRVIEPRHVSLARSGTASPSEPLLWQNRGRSQGGHRRSVDGDCWNGNCQSSAAWEHAMANDYHEPFELLDEGTRDYHRALTSLKEEIEAVDWYHQRVALASDQTLAAVLAHNRDEEIEHACMTLEWLRRTMPTWDAQLRKYLFSSESVISDAGAHGGAEAHSDRPVAHQGLRSLGIGSLKGAR